MVGDIRGYCTLKSTNTVKGYIYNLEELLKAPFLRIFDIAVGNDGFMVLNPQGIHEDVERDRTETGAGLSN